MLGGTFSAGTRIAWTVLWVSLLWVSLVVGAQVAVQAEAPTLPETMTEDNVMEFIEEHDISTVEAFVEALPPLHKQSYVSVFGSQSPVADFISTSQPRIVSWGADARFILTWTVNPDDPFTNSVEFLQPLPEEGRWSAGVIDFGSDPPELRHPTACASCHSSINKPLWGRPYVFKGTEHEYEKSKNLSADEAALYKTMTTTTNSRLTPLDRDGYNTQPRGIKFGIRRDLMLPNREFMNVIGWRHAEVLFSRLRDRDNYDSLVETVMCGGDGQPNNLRERVIGQFSQELYNPRLLSGTLEPVQGENELPSTSRARNDYKYQAFAIAFLMLHDLWQNNERVTKFYRETSNELFVDLSNSREALRYGPGQATAEDELVATHNGLFALPGSASISERGYRYGAPGVETGVLRSHSKLFARHVCGILQDDSVSIAAGASPVSEGTAATFTLTRSGETAEALTVTVSVTETEALLAANSPSTVTFAAGESSATLTVSTDDDAVVERASVVTAEVAEGEGYTVAAEAGSAEVTVEDNDEAQFAVSVDPEEIAEGEAATVTVAITNGVTFAEDQTIALGFAESTATKDEDYTVSSESLTLAAGTSSVTATVTATDDTDEESSETVAVAAEHDGAMVGQATVTIAASDVVALTASFTGVPASHDGSTIFTFNLSFSEPVAVSYKVLRDQALSASNNGTVRKCRRVDGRNDLWEVHIKPSSNNDITVTLSSPSSDCDDDDAVCTADDKLLSNEPTATISGPSAKVVAASAPLGLAPNAPNPFNASTLIPYRLATPGAVRLEIYNLLGQPMRTLVDQFQDVGSYQVSWDARDQRGAAVAAGVYLVRLHYPGGVQTRHLLYLK